MSLETLKRNLAFFACPNGIRIRRRRSQFDPLSPDSGHEFTNNNFAFHESRNKYCNYGPLTSAMCSGDLCAAIDSLSKLAVGGSECTEVWRYIKRLKSEVKWSHKVIVKVIWPNERFIFSNWSLMYVFTIKDFGSSRFTECTSITIHRSVFQFITIHDHRVTKISFPLINLVAVILVL